MHVKSIPYGQLGTIHISARSWTTVWFIAVATKATHQEWRKG